MLPNKQHRADGLCERDRNNMRTFTRWFVIFAAFFLTAHLMMGPVPGGLAETPTWHLVLALLPLLPGYFAATAYFRFVREADELIRHVLYEAVCKSFAIMVILGFVYSLATQVFGEWPDSGAILWAVGYGSFLILFSRSWRRFNV